MAKRENPEDYLDDYYSKDRFMKKAYSSHIKPMPCFKHWEPCSMPEPLPPSFKVMPGSPSLKKRKKEAGEKEEGKSKKLKKLEENKNVLTVDNMGIRSPSAKSQPKHQQ